MGDPTDQVGTLDTTGFGGVPDIKETLVSPELLEAAAEAGEEGLSDEEREDIPLSVADSEAAAEEEAEGEAGAEESGSEESEEEAPVEVAPEEEVPAEEAVESSYDPGDHSVSEVVSYIQNHPEERSAIIAKERDGKQRKGILDL